MRTLIPHTENSFCRSSSGNAAVVVVVPVEEEDEEIDWINSWLLPFVGTQKRSWLAGWPCWFDRWQYSSHRSIPFRSIMAHLLLLPASSGVVHVDAITLYISWPGWSLVWSAVWSTATLLA